MKPASIKVDKMEPKVTEPRNRPPRCIKWLKKYFWEGQSLSMRHETALRESLNDYTPWYKVVLVKHRRVVGLLLPALFFHFFWWGIFIKYDLWHLFLDKYYMSITMIFGSMIAGMTSEGGGAVAYPVMTLAFNIKPSVARDFSLMIQSCGMSAAAITIFFMKVRLEYASLIFCSLGGVAGMIFGLHVIDPVLTPPYKKMCFVCIWFTFAFALFLLNRYRKRTTYKTIPDFKIWKGIVLFLTGFVGGIFSSFAGSGLDICSFSVLTLLFRVTEKTATPTSVILMAGNTLVGFYWRHVMMDGGISKEAWEFMGVCVPIVVFGAPLGSVIGTHFHRLVLAALIYIIDTVALVSAFCLVPLTPWLIGTSVGIIVFGFIFFFIITKVGERLMMNINKRRTGNEELESCEEPDIYENKLDSRPNNVLNEQALHMSPGNEDQAARQSQIEDTSF
ncbi:uncharacterized protein LOC116296266 isoform X2 [Actinia tenebrosa]|uniref:Uncharacterized protein LOC116296266 isoform X2 n=1 Tax=Actinia tenebrosa TaxID=6105 RepID=A0A6P8I5X4_ACTTE|nr:uncharacterized protein LOC116296266 isoform X2 [Actinia tenebrosa]